MVALWTGIPGPTISKIENGHRRPNLENVVKLADALGVSVDYLVGRTMSRLAHVTAPPEIPVPSAFTRRHALMLVDLLKDGLRKSKDVAFEDEPERPPPFELPPDLEIPDPDDG